MPFRFVVNPIITREDIPDIPPHVVDPTSVFNPGAARFGDLVVLLLRVQTRGRKTYLVRAVSSDGLVFEVDGRLVRFRGWNPECEVYHVYDPRITKIENLYYITFAADTDKGCLLGTAITADFEDYDFVGFGSDADVRNGVLFPEKIHDEFMRLERPNTKDGVGPLSGDEIVIATSDDLIEWRRQATVMSGRPHFWDELIGSGPPPIKTVEGWLHVYHGVATHFASSNIYQAGVVLLDLDDPARVIARGTNNILEPRESYEMLGQVPNVVFPSGAVTSNDSEYSNVDDLVSLYYGAADTCVCVASASIGELTAACYD